MHKKHFDSDALCYQFNFDIPFIFTSPSWIEYLCAVRIRDDEGFLGAGFWMKAAENSGCELKQIKIFGWE